MMMIIKTRTLARGNINKYAAITPAIAPDAPIKGEVLSGLISTWVSEGGHPADQIKGQKPERPHAIFNIIAVNP